uniref:Uncharacterized protein n=1 Tax=Panagrellus redivivus TaxID=6233 RepID=A0A7E4W7F7_PANRE
MECRKRGRRLKTSAPCRACCPQNCLCRRCHIRLRHRLSSAKKQQTPENPFLPTRVPRSPVARFCQPLLGESIVYSILPPIGFECIYETNRVNFCPQVTVSWNNLDLEAQVSRQVVAF